MEVKPFCVCVCACVRLQDHNVSLLITNFLCNLGGMQCAYEHQSLYMVMEEGELNDAISNLA